MTALSVAGAAQAGAGLLTASAVTVGVVLLLATRTLAPALPAFLDLVLAAGLLRLSADPGWAAIGAAAAVLVVRRATVLGVARAGRAHRGAVEAEERSALAH